MQNVTYPCPICHTEFTTLCARPLPMVYRKRTDFHEEYGGRKPLAQLAQVCPGCGFAATDEVFEQFDLGEDGRRRVPTFTREEYPVQGQDRWERVAICGMAVGWETRYVADAWLKAAWCCVEEGDHEAERYYRRKAAEGFAVCLGQYGTIPESERAVITYLVGELYRRIGFQSLATEFLEAAPALVTPEQQWVCDLAVQQLRDPREWFG